jgi:hypothetical protein
MVSTFLNYILYITTAWKRDFIFNLMQRVIMIETHWDTKHLVYTDVVNLLGENINSTNKKAKFILYANKEVGLEVNA